MPIYVYGCKACGAVEEHIQRFSDPPPTKCESCGGKLKKQITSAAFQLKGGGWYKDGYASANVSADKSSAAGEGSPAKDATASKSAEPKTSEAKTKAKKGSGTAGSGTSGSSGSSTSTAAE